MKTDVLGLSQSREEDIYVPFCMHALTFDLFFMYIIFLVVDVFINKFVAFIVNFFLMVLGHTGIFFLCAHGI